MKNKILSAFFCAMFLMVGVLSINNSQASETDEIGEDNPVYTYGTYSGQGSMITCMGCPVNCLLRL